MYPNGFAMRGTLMPLTSLTPAPDYERVVEACGGLGLRLEDPAALPTALAEARHSVTGEGRPSPGERRLRGLEMPVMILAGRNLL